MITIIGLGVLKNDISLNAFNVLKTSKKVIVRTKLTESYLTLTENNIESVSLDYIYENTRSFNKLNEKLAKAVIDFSKEGNVCYCVDGAVSEDLSCKIILKKQKNVVVYNGNSKSSNMLSKIKKDTTSCHIVSAYSINGEERYSLPLLVYDLDSPILASKVKLTLTELFGDIVPCVKIYRDKLSKINLFECDFGEEFDYSSGIYIDSLPLINKEKFDFYDLLKILEILRSENGCPWDKAQTKESIIINHIEECYELVDAIKSNDESGMLEEIGDNILQNCFQIKFAEERQAFSRNDVLTEICQKLITRHTHIFGQDKAQNSENALEIWNKNKQQEKGYTTATEYLKGVANSLPAVLRAEKVMNRAKKYGFEFENIYQIFDKIKEEILEVEQALKKENKDHLFEECGDLLCASVNAVRFLGVEGEQALTNSVNKLITRFSKCEELALKDGKSLENLSIEEWNYYYDESKKS